MSDLDRMDARTRATLSKGGTHSSFADGEVIIRQGEEPAAVHVLETGAITVVVDHLGGQVVVNDLGPGDVLGEVSFVDGGRASASCIADGAVTLRTFDRAALEALVSSDPTSAAELYRAFAVVLAARVRRLTPASVSAWGGS